VSAPFTDLERGAVCLALYPYTSGFPLDRVIRDSEGSLTAQLDAAASVEDVEAGISPGDPPSEIVAKVKLRRVLLLQSGTSPSRKDIVVARINSVSDKKKNTQPNWYLRLQSGIHVAHYLIGHEEWHGTGGVEAYVDGLSITTIQKATILRTTGLLNDDEMRAVTERLVRTLELDLSSYLQSIGPPSAG
jgi:hypothetical protein